eukprot:scpid47049/ scgid15416/ 
MENMETDFCAESYCPDERAVDRGDGAGGRKETLHASQGCPQAQAGSFFFLPPPSSNMLDRHAGTGTTIANLNAVALPAHQATSASSQGRVCRLIRGNSASALQNLTYNVNRRQSYTVATQVTPCPTCVPVRSEPGSQLRQPAEVGIPGHVTVPDTCVTDASKRDKRVKFKLHGRVCVPDGSDVDTPPRTSGIGLPSHGMARGAGQLEESTEDCTEFPLRPLNGILSGRLQGTQYGSTTSLVPSRRDGAAGASSRRSDRCRAWWKEHFVDVLCVLAVLYVIGFLSWLVPRLLKANY